MANRQNFQEEEVLGKAYDARLMRRLLSYAKNYWKHFLLAIILLLCSTLIDLARPYLSKIAIDDYINVDSKPMVAYEPSSGEKGIEFGGMIYKRVDKVPENIPVERVYSLLYVDNQVFIVKGFPGSDSRGTLQKNPASADEFGYSYDIEGKTWPARLLSKNEIKTFRNNDITAVAIIGALFIAAIIIGFLLNYLQLNLLGYVGQTIIYNIRQEIFSKMQKLPLSFFDKNPVGRLVTRVTNDTETLNDMYTNVLTTLLKDVFMLVGIIVIMFRLNTTLAVISLSVMPLVLVVSFYFRMKARQVYRRIRTTLARINSALSENISGMRIIQIFNKEKEKYKEFCGIDNEYFKAGMSEIIVFGIFRPAIEMIAFLTVALVIWRGGIRVIDNTLQLGVLYAFINYISQFFQPINDLAQKYNILQGAMASSERIFMILDTPVEEDNGEKELDPGKIKGEIEFRDVWFAYNEDEWVLKNVSFKVPAGKTVAIVGATGAGKTSIINLIGRFYEIQKGRILIDGEDIRTIKKESLRKNIAVVLQDVFLFSGNIRDNIRLNETDISDEKIKKVSEYVNADKFIQKLPLKYADEVKERGATLSAGQRQLLAFARALAFDPAILILDEATANIDTETELLIQDALKKITRDRTTIIIAHRLSTIQNADNIIVLHKGAIREMGNHYELLEKKGMYYNLYRLQYKNDTIAQ